MKKLATSLVFVFLISPLSAMAWHWPAANPPYPWAVMGYYGKMTTSTLEQVLLMSHDLGSETVYSIEVGKRLSRNNRFMNFFQPIINTISIVGNFTYRSDRVGPIYEFDPYLSFRWERFPWNRYVPTTFAIGEGISYASKVPYRETRNSSQGTKKLMNYLSFELTLGIPKYPHWQIIWRIHHRSGVYGLYDAGNSGSTAVGLGLRYMFGQPE